MPLKRHWAGKRPGEPIESSSDDDFNEAEDGLPRPEIPTKQVDEQPDSPNETKPNAALSRVRGGIVSRVQARAAQAAKDQAGSEDEDDEYSQSGSEEDESSSDEDDQEEDEPAPRALLKPVFVSKQQRLTIEEREATTTIFEKEKQRIASSHALIRKEAASALVSTGGVAASDGELLPSAAERAAGLVDDEDRDSQADEEFEKWTIRELKRLRRDRAEAVKRLNGAERVEPGELDKTVVDKEPKAKMAFMQKYYHRGAFFMETDESGKATEEVYNRDFTRGTDEEQFDKRLLPKPMQLRRGQVGMAGRSKYTTMADQDTTRGVEEIGLRQHKPASLRVGKQTDPFARPQR